MKRYIDADLLKAEFTGNFTKDYTVPLIKAIIDQQPTSDVQEVRHGNWLESRCSECGRGAVFQDVNGIWRFENYCPH